MPFSWSRRPDSHRRERLDAFARIAVRMQQDGKNCHARRRPVLTRALIEEEGNGKMSVESRSLLAELPRRGVPVTLFTRKKLERRQLAIDRTTLVAGYVPTVLLALK